MAITNKCLQDFVKDGKINETQAEQIRQKAYNIAKKRKIYKYTKENIDQNPELLKEAAQEIIKDNQKVKIQKSIQLRKMKDIINNYNEAFNYFSKLPTLHNKNKTINKNKAAKLAAYEIFSNVGGFRGSKTISIETKINTFKKGYYSNFADLIDQYTKGYYKDTIKQEKFLKEVYEGFGTSGDPKITEHAKEWVKLNEMMVRDYKRTGGDLNDIDKYIPQSHDAAKMVSKKAGLEKWKKDIINKLDWEKMVDGFGNPIPENKRDKVLNEVFESITTNGTNKILEPKINKKGEIENFKPMKGNTKISEKFKEERFLIFKDAKSQNEYNNLYGKGDIIDSLFDKIDQFSMYNGIMDTLGNDPDKSIKLIKNMLYAKTKDTNTKIYDSIDALYQEINFDARAMANPTTAFLASSFRKLSTVPFLGKIAISALADIPNSVIAKTTFGMQSKRKSIIKMFGKIFETIGMMEKQTFSREEIVKMTGNIEYALYKNNKINRLGDQIYNGEITNEAKAGIIERGSRWTDEKLSNVSNFLYKRSFLTDWTEANKNIAAREAFDFIEELKNVNSIKELNDKQIKGLEVAGFTDKDLDLIKKIKSENINGIDRITINSIFNSNNLTYKDKIYISQRVNNFAEIYSRFSVPEANAYSRAIQSFRSTEGRGTFGFESKSVIMQFKSFPITYMFNQLAGSIRASGNGFSGIIKGAIPRMIALTGYGIMAFQLGEMTKNRTPFIPENETEMLELIAEGFLKGGGLGIFGDVLFRDYSEYGKDILSFAAGPSGSLIKDALLGKTKITEEAMEMLGFDIGEREDEDYEFLGDFLPDTLEKVLGSLWYTQAISEVTIDKLIRENFDDNYKQEKKKREKKLKENNQEQLLNNIFD